MAFLVGFLQVGDCEFGVMPQSVEALVAEEFLDVIEVGAALDKFGGATSPERVRADRAIEAGRSDVAADQDKQAVVSQAFAVAFQQALGSYLKQALGSYLNM